MNVYLLVAFVFALVFAAGCGLIMIDRHLEKKRDKRINKIVCNDVIPAVEEALEELTNHFMSNAKKFSDEFMEKWEN